MLLLLATATGLFGLVTMTSNGMALLAKPEYRATLGDIPYRVFWFDLWAGALYVVTAWGFGMRFRWGLYAAWLLAVLHAGGATVLWLLHFTGTSIEMGTLITSLLREGYWVLVGLYLAHLWAPDQVPRQ